MWGIYGLFPSQVSVGPIVRIDARDVQGHAVEHPDVYGWAVRRPSTHGIGCVGVSTQHKHIVGWGGTGSVWRVWVPDNMGVSLC